MKTSMNIYIDGKTKSEFKKYCERNGWNMSKVITKLIQKELNHTK